MIICRVPLRLSIGGGGTDLPSFYTKHGGYLVSATIDKYVYVMVGKSHDSGHILWYYNGRVERVDSKGKLEHAIVRETLKEFDVKEPLEIISMGDVPAGTGLGSSSAFTVGLIKALNSYYEKPKSFKQVAELACDIEINKVGSPIGKQDQYCASYGGLNELIIDTEGQVRVSPLKVDYKSFRDRLVMIKVGGQRRANDILAFQQRDIANGTKEQAMVEIRDIGVEIGVALTHSNWDLVGELMNQHWMVKKSISDKMSSVAIDDIYEVAKHHGAIGGKVIGAGGSGYMLFVCREGTQKDLQYTLSTFENIDFNFTFEGAKIIVDDIHGGVSY